MLSPRAQFHSQGKLGDPVVDEVDLGGAPYLKPTVYDSSPVDHTELGSIPKGTRGLPEGEYRHWNTNR